MIKTLVNLMKNFNEFNKAHQHHLISNTTSSIVGVSLDWYF